MSALSVSERVLDEIETTQHDLIAWLGTLVATPSITGDEGAAQALVAQTLAGLGAEGDIWELDAEAMADHPGFRPAPTGYGGRPNVVGRLRGTGGGRSLILNAHVDVVPIEDPARWSDDPRSDRVAHGRM